MGGACGAMGVCWATVEVGVCGPAVVMETSVCGPVGMAAGMPLRMGMCRSAVCVRMGRSALASGVGRRATASSHRPDLSVALRAVARVRDHLR